MLTRLLPEQVSKAWDSIAIAVEQSLPPMVLATQAVMVDVLEAILAGKADAWIYYKEGRPAAFVLTTVYRDPIVHTAHLLIYCFYALEDMSNEDWKSGIESLQRYGDYIGTTSLIAYTSNPAVARMCRQIGANTNFTLIEF